MLNNVVSGPATIPPYGGVGGQKDDSSGGASSSRDYDRDGGRGHHGYGSSNHRDDRRNRQPVRKNPK